MNIAEEIFDKRRPVRARLIRYGFRPCPGETAIHADDGSTDHTLVYRENFMDDSLIAEVTVTYSEAGRSGDSASGAAYFGPGAVKSASPRVFSRVIDAETGDEYTLVNVSSSTGSYVGQVRDEYRALLEKIADACFSKLPFSFDQPNRIAGLVADEFAVEPDNPFDKIDNAGVFRHPASGKWFALIMKVQRGRLDYSGKSEPSHRSEHREGLSPRDPGKLIEALNIKIDPDSLDSLLEEPGLHRCYHMNKKQWITVVLDETVADERVMELIRESFIRTMGPQDRQVRLSDAAGSALTSGFARGYWIIPSNPRMFDVGAGFDAGGGVLTWHHRIHVKPGDIVYIYQTEPVASIMWKCEVIDCEAGPGAKKAGSRRTENNTEKSANRCTRIMYLKRLRSYEKGQYPRSWMNEHGIKKTVRGQRRAPVELVQALEASVPG